MIPDLRPIRQSGHDRIADRSVARIGSGHGPWWIALALLAALAMSRPASALAEPTEQEVKAALIFNITRFVEWPATSFASPDAPLVVAIIGQDEVSDVLEPMLKGKNVDGHPIEVRQLRGVEDVRMGNVLYVANSEKRRLATILKTLGDASTLTVADFEHFADRGGHVNLLFVDQRVHVIVNLTSAEDCHLKLSAKLLSLAQIVGGTP